MRVTLYIAICSPKPFATWSDRVVFPYVLQSLSQIQTTDPEFSARLNGRLYNLPFNLAENSGSVVCSKRISFSLILKKNHENKQFLHYISVILRYQKSKIFYYR